MISQNQIFRLIEAEEFRQLIQRVLSNGRCRSPLVLRVLSQPDVAASAAIGLALQRLGELTYRPSQLAASLSRRLLGMQQSNGLFGSAEDPSTESLLVATATALRGLITWTAQVQASGSEVDHPTSLAIDRGLNALAEVYSDASTDVNHDAVAWAIVLWQLGDMAEFRHIVPIKDLLEMLDDSAADLVEDELCRYAHAMAA